MRTVFRKIDVILLALIACIAVGLSIAHFFHLIDAPWLKDNLALFTLLLLSLLGLHFIASYFSEEDFRITSIQLLTTIAASTFGSEVKPFADAAEMESYLAKRMREARQSICDLSWKAKISEGFSATNRQAAHQYMDQSITGAAGRVAYREIFIFNDIRRIEKFERRLSEQKAGYSCRYFREDPPIPRLQFLIIDDNEVFFFASSAQSPLVSFRSPKLCAVFQAYFDSAWNAARPLKDGPRLHDKEIAYVRKQRSQFQQLSTTPP